MIAAWHGDRAILLNPYSLESKSKQIEIEMEEKRAWVVRLSFEWVQHCLVSATIGRWCSNMVRGMRRGRTREQGAIWWFVVVHTVWVLGSPKLCSECLKRNPYNPLITIKESQYIKQLIIEHAILYPKQALIIIKGPTSYIKTQTWGKVRNRQLERNTWQQCQLMPAVGSSHQYELQKTIPAPISWAFS